MKNNWTPEEIEEMESKVEVRAIYKRRDGRLENGEEPRNKKRRVKLREGWGEESETGDKRVLEREEDKVQIPGQFLRQTEIQFERRSIEEVFVRRLVVDMVTEAWDTAKLREELWREEDNEMLGEIVTESNVTEILSTRTVKSDDECDRVPEISNVDSDSVMLDHDEIDKDTVLCLSKTVKKHV